MNPFRRIVGLFLVATGMLIAVHTIIEPLYHVSSQANPYSPFWGFINPLTASAVVLGVFFGYHRTRAIARGGGGLSNKLAPISRAYLAANLQFYGFLFIGILYFWNWFNLLSPEFTAIGADTTALVWIFIDAAVPLLAVPLGLHLARGHRE